MSDLLVLSFTPNARDLAKVRALPSRKFDPATNCWHAAYNRENWAALLGAGYGAALTGIVEPIRSGYAIDARKELVKVMVPYSPVNSELCKRIPEARKWDEGKRAWYCKATSRNLKYLRMKFPLAEWTDTAEALYQKLVVDPEVETADIQAQKIVLATDVGVEVNDYKFGGPSPYAHQRRAFLLS